MLKEAKWIAVPVDYGTVYPVFRRTFNLEKPVLNATLTVTAIGCYIAYLNEKRVGDFVFAPGWTAYDQRLQVQEYDVTEQLSQKNILDMR